MQHTQISPAQRTSLTASSLYILERMLPEQESACACRCAHICLYVRTPTCQKLSNLKPNRSELTYTHLYTIATATVVVREAFTPNFVSSGLYK